MNLTTTLILYFKKFGFNFVLTLSFCGTFCFYSFTFYDLFYELQHYFLLDEHFVLDNKLVLSRFTWSGCVWHFSDSQENIGETLPLMTGLVYTRWLIRLTPNSGYIMNLWQLTTISLLSFVNQVMNTSIMSWEYCCSEELMLTQNNVTMSIVGLQTRTETGLDWVRPNCSGHQQWSLASGGSLLTSTSWHSPDRDCAHLSVHVFTSFITTWHFAKFIHHFNNYLFLFKVL